MQKFFLSKRKTKTSFMQERMTNISAKTLSQSIPGYDWNGRIAHGNRKEF